MQRTVLSQLLRAAVLLCLLTAALFAVTVRGLPWLSFRQESQVAAHLIKLLSEDDSLSTEVALQEVAKLGNAGIEPLVQAAAERRADTAMTARRMIGELLATWRIEATVDPESQLAVRLSLLARALAAHAQELGPLGQEWANGVVLDIIDLTEALPPKQVAPMLADCSAVLDAIPARSTRKRTPELESRGDNPQPELPGIPPQVPALAIPSEQVIMAPAEASARETQELGQANPLPKNVQPATDSPVARRARPWTPAWQQHQLHDDSSQTPPGSTSSLRVQPNPSAAPNTPMIVVDPPTPAEMEHQLTLLRADTTRELFVRLADADFYTTGMIERVLEERGFESAEFPLGLRLITTDVADRVALVDDVSILPARTARHWLRELLQDTSAEVRLRALTAMATTADPSLVTIARELATQDTDPRVTELALRILRESR